MVQKSANACMFCGQVPCECKKPKAPIAKKKSPPTTQPVTTTDTAPTRKPITSTKPIPTTPAPTTPVPTKKLPEPQAPKNALSGHHSSKKKDPILTQFLLSILVRFPEPDPVFLEEHRDELDLPSVKIDALIWKGRLARDARKRAARRTGGSQGT